MAILRTIKAISKRRTTSRYLGVIVVMISVIVSSSFLGFSLRTDTLLDSLLLEEARAFSKEITLLQTWVRKQGGIYIRRSNGRDATSDEVSGESEKAFRHLNTSEVTRELSALSQQSGIVRFNGTSLFPFNPLNQPDAFERQALDRLRNGEQEVFGYEETEAGLVFRYLSPLETKKGCLKCHTDGSFQIGRIDSALSFTIPADGIRQDKRLNQVWMAISAAVIIGFAGLSVYWLGQRFGRYLDDADERLEKMACQDYLTGLINRMVGLDLLKSEINRAERNGRDLSVAIIDIDHFKKINDRMGHLVGDKALRSFSETLQQSVRSSDIAFRYGGEEFALIMPETGIKGATRLTERLRSEIEKRRVETDSGDLRMTVSIGIAQFRSGMSSEALLGNADEGLYNAKHNGRNQIQSAPREQKLT
jgi:diguanylate cyclase (GGDEF)-like protein